MILTREQKKWGLITGCSIVLMAFLAGVTYEGIHLNFYVVGDFVKTAKLVEANVNLYKVEIVLWLGIVLLDVLVSIGIYKIYKTTQKQFALLALFLRLIYSFVLFVAVIELALPLLLENELPYISLYFNMFEKIWSLGLIIFGLHLIVLGIIVYRSLVGSKFWGAFLVFGGVCYMLVHTLKSYFPNLGEINGQIEAVLMIPMALSEIGFSVWLIVMFFKEKNETQL